MILEERISMFRNGFVQAVKAKGTVYFYVRISFRNEQKKTRSRNVLGLGQKENALSLLQSWIDEEKNIPDNMKGYKKEQFEKWIKYIENK